MPNGEVVTPQENQEDDFTKVTIKLRGDILERWETADPVLGQCELIVVMNSLNEFDITKSKFKLGDGQHKFSELGYAIDVGDIYNKQNEINESIGKIQGRLDTKVDIEEGKQLSSNDFTTFEKDKLENIEEDANNYTHPVTHPASMIVENSEKRFVSDTKIAEWDAIKNSVIVSIPTSSWSDTAPYAATIAVPGLKASDIVIIHAYTPKEIGVEATNLRRKLTGFITDGESKDGQMIFYCVQNKPTNDFDVLLKGVSANG